MKTSTILLAIGVVGAAIGAAFLSKDEPSKPSSAPNPNVGPGVTPGTYPPGTGGVLTLACQGISTLREPLRTQVRGAIASGLSPIQREVLAQSLDPVCPAAAAEVRATPATGPSTLAPTPGATGPISFFAPKPPPTFAPLPGGPAPTDDSRAVDAIVAAWAALSPAQAPVYGRPLTLEQYKYLWNETKVVDDLERASVPNSGNLVVDRVRRLMQLYKDQFNYYPNRGAICVLPTIASLLDTSGSHGPYPVCEWWTSNPGARLGI